jgi:ribosomal protein L16 Arg81 hydroxylase
MITMTTIHDLAFLVAPVDPATFTRDYWEQKPLVIRRRDHAHYQDLLSLADVDRLLTTTSIRSPSVRVLKDGNEIPLTDLNGYGRISVIEALYEQYRGGATIALNFLQERSSALMELCQALASDFSASVQVNVYLTPPDEKGLSTHYDTHDVFVLQVEGVKHWRLYKDPIRLPLAGQPYREGEAEPWEFLEEFDLHPGDAIYIPRGFGHEAVALDATSLHMTVGVQPVTWAAVLLEAVEEVIRRHHRFRQSLPLGFVTDERTRATAERHLIALVNDVGRELCPAWTIDNAVELALQGMRPPLEGHLLDLHTVNTLTMETHLRRRAGVDARLSTDDDKVCLHYQGKLIRFPSFIERDLKFVITHDDEFTAAHLPGDLDDSSRLTLLRRLTTEGFLTICSNHRTDWRVPVIESTRL